jgi:hypothetical protein
LTTLVNPNPKAVPIGTRPRPRRGACWHVVCFTWELVRHHGQAWGVQFADQDPDSLLVRLNAFHHDRFAIRSEPLVGGKRMVGLMPCPQFLGDLSCRLWAKAEIIKMPHEPRLDQV